MNTDFDVFWSAGMKDTCKSSEKMRVFKFRVEIPKSEAAAYLVQYDNLACDISIQAYTLEDAYFMLDAIFLSSPFDIYPVPFK